MYFCVLYIIFGILYIRMLNVLQEAGNSGRFFYILKIQSLHVVIGFFLMWSIGR